MKFDFQNLFGIPAQDVKPLCIIAPFLPKNMAQQFGFTQSFAGKPYTCFQHEKFTLIKTLIGPLFTGDAVLNLQETPCQDIILIGACGSLDDIRCPIGSVVAPTSCLSMESFTQMLTGDFSNVQKIQPAGDLHTIFLPSAEPVNCASVGSIILEHDHLEDLKKLKIDVLEMECASIFAAATSINRNAAALLYVTDIIGKTSPYDIIDANAAASINRAQNELTEIILQIHHN